MDPSIRVEAEPSATPSPIIVVTLTIPTDHRALAARRQRWADATHELLVPLHALPPTPAVAACDNLGKAIASTRAEIDDAEKTLARTAGAVATAIADGRDPAKIEADAQALSAKLDALLVRLPAMEAKILEAMRQRDAEGAVSHRSARVKLAAKLSARLEAVVAGLGLDRIAADGLDEVAALQDALATCAKG